MRNQTDPGPPSRSSLPVWLLLLISLVAAAAALRLAWGARPDVPELVRRPLTSEELQALDPNLGQTIDTLVNPNVPVRVGGRYRVRIVEPARQQADGVARIGGRVTFVAGARPGEVHTVEVVALRGNIAEAVPLGPPEPLTQPIQIVDGSPSPPLVLHTGIVEGVGSRGDGRVMLDGIPVYIPGATTGERVVFEVIRRGERWATGRLVEKLSIRGDTPHDSIAPAPAGGKGEPIRVGEVHEVTITERAYRAPDRDGVARIGGVPVIVPGTQTGQTLRIRIVEVRERYAIGERIVESP